MSIILDCFGTMVLFITPTAVELSVWVGELGRQANLKKLLESKELAT